MTTIFDVKDAAILDQVEGKRRTQFTAERANGALTVTKIRSAR
jgi:Cu/Ag efflux protein CusF